VLSILLMLLRVWLLQAEPLRPMRWLIWMPGQPLMLLRASLLLLLLLLLR
jgi:hypothetical protein